MFYLSIRDLDLNGKRVFIRVDFNVPLQKNDRGDMEISSDKRIKASLSTIQYALDHGAGVILATNGHQRDEPVALAIGLGIIAYALAVAFYTLLGIVRLRRADKREESRKFIGQPQAR